MKAIRCFVALNLDIPAVRRISELQDKLRSRAKGQPLRVGWVPPANLHLTLKFLGDIPAETMPAVRDRLAERLLGRPAFTMQVRGVGAFPNVDQARVLWVGLTDDGGHLDRLAADMDQWLVDLGFARETRPFRPHVTLGRVREGSAAGLIAGDEALELGPALAQEVVFFESVLQRRGAEYRALGRYGLSRGETPRGEAAPREPSRDPTGNQEPG